MTQKGKSDRADERPTNDIGTKKADLTSALDLSEGLLRESELLQSVIDGYPIPAFVIGRDHKVIYWNHALEELSGIKAENVIGTRQHWRAFYESKRPCMADLLVAEAKEGIEKWYEGKCRKSNLIEEAYEATDFFPYLGEKGRWLRFTAAALRDSTGEPVGAIETLEDITERKVAEEALRKAHDELEIRVQERTRELSDSSRALKAEVVERQQKEKELKDREKELKIKSERLEEMNTALKVLLEQRDQDRKELEENILANVKELILPYVDNLRKSQLNDYQVSHIEVIESNLNNIISPFLRSLTSKYLNLTPKETQVSTLIKEGKTSKDISELLTMSLAAVEFHRSNIRKKLGLRNKKANLQSHLSSFL